MTGFDNESDTRNDRLFDALNRQLTLSKKFGTADSGGHPLTAPEGTATIGRMVDRFKRAELQNILKNRGSYRNFSMYAIRVHQFGDPDVLKWEQAPDPAPQAGQVLVDVKAAGVNPVETYIRRGIYGPKEFPYTPGSDGAGVVEEIGASVIDVTVGQRVYISKTLTGTYAEKSLCPANGVHALPDHLTFQQGAGVGTPYATAYYALYLRAHARAGETVLIHGASGGVGLAAVQLARAAGLMVIGTGGTDRGRELVMREGAHHVLDHHAKDYLDEVKNRITAGKGIDLILEMLANVNLAKDLPVLAMNGRVIVIGSRGPIEITPRDTMARNSDIRGMSLMHMSDDERAAIHAAIGAGLENKSLRPIVGKEFSFEDAAKSHVEVIEGKAFGKIVLARE